MAVSCNLSQYFANLADQGSQGVYKIQVSAPARLNSSEFLDGVLASGDSGCQFHLGTKDLG